MGRKRKGGQSNGLRVSSSDSGDVARAVTTIHSRQEELRESALFAELLEALPKTAVTELVVYGLGNVSNGLNRISQFQLALALLLHSALSVASPVVVYDPSFESDDLELLLALGCRVLDVNEEGRRLADTGGTHLFFMPHCDLWLYRNVVEVNLAAGLLAHTLIVGNSFGDYLDRLYTSNDSNKGHQSFLANNVVNLLQEIPLRTIFESEDRAFNNTSVHMFSGLSRVKPSGQEEGGGSEVR